MENFMSGFEEVIPRTLINNFDEGELELLISGVGSINIKDWRDNTEYKNYSDNDKVILWFWRAVLSFGDARRSKLLQFVTGTSRVPMNGFAVSVTYNNNYTHKIYNLRQRFLFFFIVPDLIVIN